MGLEDERFRIIEKRLTLIEKELVELQTKQEHEDGSIESIYSVLIKDKEEMKTLSNAVAEMCILFKELNKDTEDNCQSLKELQEQVSAQRVSLNEQIASQKASINTLKWMCGGLLSIVTVFLAFLLQYWL